MPLTTARHERRVTLAETVVLKPMTVHGLDTLVRAVRQRIETEGLRPFSKRTGIPLGQLRSFIAGRASLSTSLQSIASVMGMRLVIAPAAPRGLRTSPLPAELIKALDLPSDASVLQAVDAINRDAVASKLRRGLHLIQEMTERAKTAAELLPQLAGESPARMIPFAEQVRFNADTGEVEFKESSDLWVAVAGRVLPPWARTERLVCLRVAGDSMESMAVALVVVDKDRQAAVDEQQFVVRIVEALAVKRLRQVGSQWSLVSEGLAHQSRPMTAEDRIVGRVVWCGPRGAAVR